MGAMVDADLKLYIGATEYGTLGQPITFVNALAGEITAHPLNPFYLWNDKGGVLNSVPAKEINIEIDDMWVQDEALGTGDGTPNQTFNTFLTPVLIDTDSLADLVLKVAGTAWSKVSTFSGQAANAQVFTITAAGLVTFGDGVNGKPPAVGEAVTLTYAPDLAAYGKSIYEGLWFEVLSIGVTTNVVTVTDELQNAQGTTLVTTSNIRLNSVTGVWLAGDPDHTGTNYYTGGSYDVSTGEITLGVALPYSDAAVIITYSYISIDDLESTYTAIGKDTPHEFTNPIPQNNAKLLYFRLNVPAGATPSGGSNFAFRLKFSYLQ